MKTRRRLLLFMFGFLCTQSFGVYSRSEPVVCAVACAALLAGGVVTARYIKRSIEKVTDAKKALITRGFSDVAARRAYRVACRQLGLQSGVAVVGGLVLLGVALRAAWSWKNQPVPVQEAWGASAGTATHVEQEKKEQVQESPGANAEATTPTKQEVVTPLEPLEPPSKVRLLELQLRLNAIAAAGFPELVEGSGDFLASPGGGGLAVPKSPGRKRDRTEKISSDDTVIILALADIYALAALGSINELEQQFPDSYRLKSLLRQISWSGIPSPLHAAFENKHVNIVKWLIERGMDINSVSEETGATLLHVAVQAGDVEMVQYLLEKEADPYKRNNRNGGLSPFDYARLLEFELHALVTLGEVAQRDVFTRHARIVKLFPEPPAGFEATQSYLDVMASYQANAIERSTKFMASLQKGQREMSVTPSPEN